MVKGSNPGGARFSAIQTGPGAHPASCTMGTRSFLGVKYDRGMLLTTHPLLVPRSWKRRAIPLPTLWATTGPVMGTLHFTHIQQNHDIQVWWTPLASPSTWPGCFIVHTPQPYKQWNSSCECKWEQLSGVSVWCDSVQQQVRNRLNRLQILYVRREIVLCAHTIVRVYCVCQVSHT